MHHRIAADWCHCCGRRDSPTADVWFPLQPNAEHATQADHRAGYGWPPERIRYLRMCADCSVAIYDAATDPKAGRIIRAPNPKRWFKGWKR